MKIMIPITGDDIFFPKSEFFFPKPLIDVAGKPLIQHVVEGLRSKFPSGSFIFITDKEMNSRYSLASSLQIIAGTNSVIIQKSGETSGAIPSCLLSVDNVDDDESLLIVNSDLVVQNTAHFNFDTFESSHADAVVPHFNSIHPRWSYIRFDGNNEIAQIHEKEVVSKCALMGMYYFKRAGDFMEAAKNAMLSNDSVNNMFYLSAAVNQLLLDNKTVETFSCETGTFDLLYSAEQVKKFTAVNNFSSNRNSFYNKLNVVIPAAGSGSRFADQGWKKPKPFIEVDGDMMVAKVIKNVTPPSVKPTLILQKEHKEKYISETQSITNKLNCNVYYLDNITEGTLCTVLEALASMSMAYPVLVANSDQLVDFDVEAFINDCHDRKLDGSILTFIDETRDPKWSFVDIDDCGHVTEVAEKKPISHIATVGIYYFSRASDLLLAAMDMFIANDRVNGEFYTCPVYNFMIKRGAKIGQFLVDKSAMHGLGTPEDLSLYLSSIGAPASKDAPEGF